MGSPPVDPPDAAGYSGTPLPRKLGFKPGVRIAVLNAPPRYSPLVDPLPANVVIGARFTPRTDIVHLFVERRAVLARTLRSLRDRMRDDAAVWVSWPRKSAGRPTDITEDVIRDVALPMGLVDVKVCAVDATWSGLKLVVRRELRRG
jgi:hypothetical protein